ncbi:MAG: OB-fold nucleic acid binding domain-containing protein [Thermoplasmata archaeon]
MPSPEERYQFVEDLLSEEEFLDRIKEERERYNGLLNDDALALKIVSEYGRNQDSISKIRDLKPKEEATIQGKIIDLGRLRTFTTKRGRKGSVRNIRIDDGTGSVKVVFWNEETKRVEDEMDIGTEIKVIHGYTQDRGYGLQVSAGKWGEIIVRDESDEIGEND